MVPAIPRIIHQTSRDAQIPPAWAPFQRSWREHHPGWEYRLWTDVDLRELVEREYRWFLPVYDLYDEQARRDAARYFVMHRHGGVLADLDVESVRPVDELLSGEQVVLGLEPPAHVAMPLAQRRRFERIVGNAFIASEPAHPFWSHVFMMLVASHRKPSPGDAAGPFFLTRALALFPEPARVSLLPSEILYPISRQESREGLLHDPMERARVSTRAFAIHHWSGSWPSRDARESREPRDTAPRDTTRDLEVGPARFVLFDGGKARLSARFDLEAQEKREDVIGALIHVGPAISALPRSEEVGPETLRISCMMVTRRRARMAKRAIHCFREQTYPDKELVIVDDDDDDTLARYVAGLADPRIVHVRLPPGDTTLGELRNLAVEKSRGELVCQWDDDDLSHPRRLSFQIAAQASLAADASFLARHQLLWLDRPRLAVSHRRVWEGSMICKKALMPRYSAIRRGEDTPVAQGILERCRVVVLDAPELYTYVFHGANTFHERHFERIWSTASERCEGADYAPRMERILRALPRAVARDIAAELGALDTRAPELAWADEA